MWAASCGKALESHLSRTRDIAAAKAFFRKALKRHGQPRTITLDGFAPTHSLLRRMGLRNEFNFDGRIRSGSAPANISTMWWNKIIDASNHASSQCSGSRSSIMRGE
jgi:transposase-like protein